MNCSTDGVGMENCSMGLFFEAIGCTPEKKPLTVEGWRQIQVSSPSKTAKVKKLPTNTWFLFTTALRRTYHAYFTDIYLPSL